MAKKELPNKASFNKGRGDFNENPKIPGLSAKAFSVIKFILGLCLLPFVYSTTRSFLVEFSLVEKSSQDHFWWGVTFLLVVYLFIWEPAVVYLKGQKILEFIFAFVKPLVKVAPYLVPVYFLLLLAAYGMAMLFSPSSGVAAVFIFLFGTSVALHLVFGAKSLRTKQQDFLKANYIFGFALVYILNIMLLSFFFSVIFEEFSFVNFCNSSFQASGGIFGSVFNQLFVSNP